MGEGKKISPAITFGVVALVLIAVVALGMKLMRGGQKAEPTVAESQQHLPLSKMNEAAKTRMGQSGAGGKMGGAYGRPPMGKPGGYGYPGAPGR